MKLLSGSCELTSYLIEYDHSVICFGYSQGFGYSRSKLGSPEPTAEFEGGQNDIVSLPKTC